MRSLESEFGTSKDDDVVKQILEKGNIVESGVSYPYSPMSANVVGVRLSLVPYTDLHPSSAELRSRRCEEHLPGRLCRSLDVEEVERATTGKGCTDAKSWIPIPRMQIPPRQTCMKGRTPTDV